MVEEIGMKGRTVLITGGTSGIGLETARALAKKGALIILGARNLALAEKVKQEIVEKCPGADIEVPAIPLDLACTDSIRRFSDDFLKTDRPLHVLINNAGMNATGDQEWYTEAKVGGMAQVNYLGAYYLTRLLERRLIESKARIVNVTSISHRLVEIKDSHAFLFEWKHGTYPLSKFADILFAYEAQRRMGAKGVESCAVDPGCVRSQIWNNTPFEKGFLRRFINTFYSPPEDGCRAVVHAASAPWEGQATALGGGRRQTYGAPEQDLRMYARGLLALPSVTWFTGPWHGPVGSLGTILWAISSVMHSNWDYPVRFLTGGLVGSGTYLVPSSPLSYSERLAKELWEESARVLGLPAEVQG